MIEGFSPDRRFERKGDPRDVVVRTLAAMIERFDVYLRLGSVGKTHLQLGYDFSLDNIAFVDIKSIYNVTYVFVVTVQEASWQKRQ